MGARVDKLLPSRARVDIGRPARLAPVGSVGYRCRFF